MTFPLKIIIAGFVLLVASMFASMAMLGAGWVAHENAICRPSCSFCKRGRVSSDRERDL